MKTARPVRPRLVLLGDALVVAAIVAAAFALLKPSLVELLARPFMDDYVAVLPTTAWAALKVWTFWSLSAVVVAGLLLRSAPALGVLDATLVGGISLWIVAWLGGQALGPIGLYRAWTIWTALAVAAVALWRRPPAVARPALTPGLKLSALTFALIGPVLLLEQLGSPLPPFMDVLATPAGAQRIMTFGLYLPLDNDPYGMFGGSSQLPGLELFYALLGFGSRVELAVLADTAAILPVAALLIFATYRFGKTIGGDVVGGMATLFLLATVLFRVLPYMHGRTVSFVLLGVGLGFVLDERRHPVRLALGAVLLGTCVGTHAIMGALGMMVVAAILLLWLLRGELGAAISAVGLLAGATLVALPEVAVGLRLPIPYPTLPLLQIVGVAVIWRAAWGLHRRPATGRGRWLGWTLAAVVVWAVLRHPSWAMINYHHTRFPLLVYTGGLGVAMMLATDCLAAARRRAAGAAPAPPFQGEVIAAALLIGMAVEYASNRWSDISSDPEIRVAITDWFWKIDYWYPWILTVPAGYLAAWLYRRVAPRFAVFLVLALLAIPWQERVDPAASPDSPGDPNYTQHALVEAWVYHLLTAKQGYWGNTLDPRWAQTPAQLGLNDMLRQEIAAGRITHATRIVHLEAGYIYLYRPYLMFAVYTGVHADPYMEVGDLDWDRSSRQRRLEEAPARLAERPTYVAIHGEPELPPGALDAYEELYRRDDVRLLRLAAGSSSSGENRP